MPELDLTPIIILLSACVAFLFLLFLVTVGLRWQLGRIERLLAVRKEAPPVRTEPEEVIAEPGGPFEDFLNADPARKLLSKKEQSAAYRKWRREKGMNWSNS